MIKVNIYVLRCLLFSCCLTTRSCIIPTWPATRTGFPPATTSTAAASAAGMVSWLSVYPNCVHMYMTMSSIFQFRVIAWRNLICFFISDLVNVFERLRQLELQLVCLFHTVVFLCVEAVVCGSMVRCKDVNSKHLRCCVLVQGAVRV